jgi:hypothetical protein
MNKTKLVGILYSNDSIEVVDLNKRIKLEIEESKEFGDIYKYKGTTMYMYEDVVYCVGKDKKEIQKLLNEFNNDSEVKEYYNME